MGTQRGPDFAFVQGNTGHTQTDSGNPVKIGGYASATPPTAVSDGQRVNAWFDLEGRLQVSASLVPPAVSDDTSTGLVSVPITGTTGSVTIVGAPGAGVSLLIENVFCSNSHPTTGVDVSLIENGTTRVKGHCAHKGGGFVKDYARPWKLTANTALTATTSAAVDSVFVNVQFYTGT